MIPCWTLFHLLALAPPPAVSDELLPPVPVLVNGRPLDVERDGQAAPFFGDLDGDGKRHLLVGQFDDGRLRIYRNRGTNTRPLFASFTWFEAGGQTGRVPVG